MEHLTTRRRRACPTSRFARVRRSGTLSSFQDPGIPAAWKLFHTFNTMVISFPSLVTAFTICASIEVAGRLRGGTGLFGWIRTRPWGNPLVSSVLLAMLLFLVGGFGGAVNAAYALNSVVHNTATEAYGSGALQASWQTLSRVSALGGIILFASAGFFVLVMVGTLLAGPRRGHEAIEWAESLGTPEEAQRASVWDRLGLWFVLPVGLVVIAYAVPLWDIFHLTRYGSRGYKPF